MDGAQCVAQKIHAAQLPDAAGSLWLALPTIAHASCPEHRKTWIGPYIISEREASNTIYDRIIFSADNLSRTDMHARLGLTVVCKYGDHMHVPFIRGAHAQDLGTGSR